MYYCQVAKNRDHPQHRCHAVEEGANNQQHDSFGPLEKPNFARRNEIFSSATCVADHHRSGHHNRRQDHIRWPIDGSVVDQQPDQEGDIGIAVEYRIKKRSETCYAIRFPATRPSTISKSPAKMITHPAVLKFPTARNVAAAMSITSPKNVRTFGLIFDSANARTITRMIRSR